MRHIIFAIVTSSLVFTAAGCKDKKLSKGDLVKLKEEACACQDKSCADKAMKKLEDGASDSWGDEEIGLGMEIAFCTAKFGGE
jgi:hypothetical protein